MVEVDIPINHINLNVQVTSGMLPANTSPRFCIDEDQNVFDEILCSDDVSETACFDDGSSDNDSSCSSDDSSIGDVSEFTDEEDNDYDLNDLLNSRDDENCDDSPSGSLTLDSQDDDLQEHISTVPVDNSNSFPLLTATNDQATNTQRCPQPTLPNTSKHCFGYVIVGDNIDKNIRPSYQRQDHTTQSLHYFHSYAVLNRVDISRLSDSRSSDIVISPEKILPDSSECQKLLNDFEILVARCGVCVCVCVCVCV